MTKNIDFDTAPTHCVGTMSRFFEDFQKFGNNNCFRHKTDQNIKWARFTSESMDKIYSSASSDRQNLSWSTRST